MSDGERDIVMLIQANDKSWVDEWLDSLRDKGTQARIERQIDKLGRGLGYALRDRKTVVVLIGGGDKSSQSKDIESARRLWKEEPEEITQQEAPNAEGETQ